MARISRNQIAARYLQGEGIEIGALHNPMRAPRKARVSYVDCLPLKELQALYPHVHPRKFVPVDILDDGQTLRTLDAASQDFIIANHLLEHCQDPIRTLLRFFEVLRDGGILFLAIPDMRFTFDHDRPPTTLEHVIEDYERGPEHSKEAHIREVIRITEKITELDAVEVRVRELMENDSCIHYHAWSQHEMFRLFEHVRSRVAFDIEQFVDLRGECLFVLRKGNLPASRPLEAKDKKRAKQPYVHQLLGRGST